MNIKSISKILIVVASAILFLSAIGSAQNCDFKNVALSDKEEVTFTIYYTVFGIYVNAGEAKFTTSVEKYGNRNVFHIVGVGKSNSRYEWIFKVRDRYETFMDTTTMVPYKFIRDVNEGDYSFKEEIFFDHQKQIAFTDNKEYAVPNCIQDVLSAVFYARNIDFNRYKIDDKIPIKMFLDKQVYNIYVRYLGKEIVKTKYGKYRAIKFRPMLIKGSIFEGGENGTVWVSDDPNHILLRIESPIIVGKIKVDMANYKNLRFPLSSQIK